MVAVGYPRRKGKRLLRLGKLNRPESLSEMALRELRNAIIDGRLKLGDQLSESRLSAMLGISKTPVREALQELRREGLVKIDPQRGTSIFCLEDAEIDHIADFRALLETAAARRILAGDRGDACRRMRDVVERMHQALARNDVETYRRLDADLHFVLIEHCDNACIAEAYGLISAKVGALRTRAHDDKNVVDSSLAVHTRLLELFEAGDESGFCLLLEQHIRNAGRDYRAWLARQAASPPPDQPPRRPRRGATVA
jgi:DNA-binding GntR family transcriptional regulator